MTVLRCLVACNRLTFTVLAEYSGERLRTWKYCRVQPKRYPS